MVSLMKSSKPGLSVYRPVSHESMSLVRTIQAECASSISTFRGAKEPRLNILHPSILPAIRGKDRDRLLEDAPSTSEDEYDMKIKSFVFRLKSDVRHCNIALALEEDEEGHYSDEFRAFRKLAAESNERVDDFVLLSPHVTVGYLDPAQALASVLEKLDGFRGEEIRFDPTMSNVGKVRRLHKPHTPFPESSGIEIQPHNPRGMPQGFLRSLRTRVNTE